MTSFMNKIKSMMTNKNNLETTKTPENYENYENCNNCQNCHNCLNYENRENFVENFDADKAEKRTYLEYAFFLVLIIFTCVYVFSPQTIDMEHLTLENLKKSTPRLVTAICSVLFLLLMVGLSVFYNSTSIVSLCLIVLIIFIHKTTMKGVVLNVAGKEVVNLPAEAKTGFNFF